MDIEWKTLTFFTFLKKQGNDLFLPLPNIVGDSRHFSGLFNRDALHPMNVPMQISAKQKIYHDQRHPCADGMAAGATLPRNLQENACVLWRLLQAAQLKFQRGMLCLIIIPRRGFGNLRLGLVQFGLSQFND